jgi:SAM-dependent methyltransferase
LRRPPCSPARSAAPPDVVLDGSPNLFFVSSCLRVFSWCALRSISGCHARRRARGRRSSRRRSSRTSAAFPRPTGGRRGAGLAHVTAADVRYDLGSGDGRIPIAAAKRYGAFGVGVEIDAKLNRRAEDNAKAAGVVDRVRFLTQDLFEADISQATVVTLFLLPRINQELMPKLRRELRPGTRIVSHQFDMGEQWPPEKSQDVNGLMIYLWTIK